MTRTTGFRDGYATGLSVLALILHGCGSEPTRLATPPGPSVTTGQLQAKHEPLCRKGNPLSYDVFGKRYYVMKTGAGYAEQGTASWYGPNFHGHTTSCGTTYDMYEMTAAHKTLPIPTYCEVTNLDNGRTTIVKVNDRGPFHSDRIIDLSYAAATRLGIVAKGTANVQVRALDAGLPLPAEGGELAEASTATGLAATRPVPAAPEPVALKTTLTSTQAAQFASEVKTEPAIDPLAKVGGSGSSQSDAPVIALSATDRGTQLLPSHAVPQAAALPMRALAQPEPSVIHPVSADPKPLPAAFVKTAAVPAAASAPGGLYLQAGAFARRHNAERLKSELDRVVGSNVKVAQSDSRSGALYRVHIGPLPNSASAGKVSQTLLRMGFRSHRLVID